MSPALAFVAGTLPACPRAQHLCPRAVPEVLHQQLSIVHRRLKRPRCPRAGWLPLGLLEPLRPLASHLPINWRHVLVLGTPDPLLRWRRRMLYLV
jgi:hypothetical protein